MNKDIIRYICASLPYGIKILHESWNYEWDDELSLVERVVGIDQDFIYTKIIDTHTGEEYKDDRLPIDTFYDKDDKLYLRPMESMTKEERKEYANLLFADLGGVKEDYHRSIAYLLENHFDFCNFIEKGYAIDYTTLNIKIY